MVSINNSGLAGFPAELSATMDGSNKTIGTLLFNPVQIIFDNQGTVDVIRRTISNMNVLLTAMIAVGLGQNTPATRSSTLIQPIFATPRYNGMSRPSAGS